jgi:hypothetical protein
MEIENAPVEETGEQQTETTGQGEAGQQDAAADRLLAQFEQFTGSVNERFDRLEQAQQPEEEEDEEEDLSAFELSPDDFEDDDFTDDGTLTPEAQKRAFSQMVKAAVQAELAPERARQADERRSAEADALEQKYPELAEPEVQQKMIERTQEFAQRIGQPELWREPKLLEMVYLADTASRRAGDEIPAGSTQGVRLESGTGAPPAQSSQQPDDGDRIVALAKKRHHRVGSA